MLQTLLALLAGSWSSLKSRQELVVEILTLRQQLVVYEREVNRPKLNRVDRAFWLVLMRLWPRWRDTLVIVKPATVIGWHRKGATTGETGIHFRGCGEIHRSCTI